MKKFWKWTNLTESNPTERILTLNGTIAEESWFDDDITPQLFKSELTAARVILQFGLTLRAVIVWLRLRFTIC